MHANLLDRSNDLRMNDLRNSPFLAFPRRFVRTLQPLAACHVLAATHAMLADDRPHHVPMSPAGVSPHLLADRRLDGG